MRSLPRHFVFIVVCAFCIGRSAGDASAATPVPRVYVIPTLRLDGLGNSAALGVSADGSTVVGGASSPNSPTGGEAYRWTVGGGIEGLGFVAGARNAFATSCSADGSVITGDIEPTSSTEAFRWTRATGIQLLPGALGFGRGGIGYAVSNDGITIVGNQGTSTGTAQATRWTPAGAQMLGLARPGSTYAEARAVSANGSIIGLTDNGGTSGTAFKWTQSGGFESLPDIPQGAGATAVHGMSADGSTIVGTSQVSTNFYPVRWRNGVAEYIGLDSSGGAHQGLARDATADGSIVVGNIPGGGVFIWDVVHGYRNLNTVLQDEYGVGAGFRTIGGISDDGTVFAGARVDDKGLVVVLPEPSAALFIALAAFTSSRRKRRTRL